MLRSASRRSTIHAAGQSVSSLLYCFIVRSVLFRHSSVSPMTPHSQYLSLSRCLYSLLVSVTWRAFGDLRLPIASHGVALIYGRLRPCWLNIDDRNAKQLPNIVHVTAFTPALCATNLNICQRATVTAPPIVIRAIVWVSIVVKFIQRHDDWQITARIVMQTYNYPIYFF